MISSALPLTAAVPLLVASLVIVLRGRVLLRRGLTLGTNPALMV
jgi:hypothetical protein